MRQQTKTTATIDALTYVSGIVAYKVGGRKGALLYGIGVLLGSAGTIINVEARGFLQANKPTENAPS